ncbi:O-antigen ligase family protein [Georgenia muralis]
MREYLLPGVLTAAAVAAALWLPRLALSVRAAFAVFFLAMLANGVALDVGPATVRVELLALALLVLAAVLDGRGTTPPPVRAGAVAMAGLAAWWAASFVSSVLVAPEPVRSLFMLLNLTAGVAAYFLVLRLAPHHAALVRTGTWILGAVSAVSLVLLVALPPETTPLVASSQGGGLPRVRGLALEPNLMGGLCAGWLAVMVHRRRQLSTRHLLLALPVVIALVLTNTRAAWVALAVVLAYWALTRHGRLLRSPPALMVYALGAGLLLARWGELRAEPGSLVWKIENLLNFEIGTGSYRVDTWRLALADLDAADAWLFGLGVNSYAQRHPVDITGVTEGYVGNLWIAWLYDSGVVGVLGFAVLLLALWARSADRLGALPVFVAVVLTSTSTNGFWMTFPWVFLALAGTPARPAVPVGGTGRVRPGELPRRDPAAADRVTVTAGAAPPEAPGVGPEAGGVGGTRGEGGHP